MSDPLVLPCTDHGESLRTALEQVDLRTPLAGCGPILLKPNLVNGSPFPVTTDPAFTGAVIDRLRRITDAPITIAEGSGCADRETPEIFETLGYTDLAREKNVTLLDLNHAPLVHKSRPRCPVFPDMWLPEVAFTHCVISLPVLKAHSLATVTGTMKNMMGFAPPSHYSRGGWKKNRFHARLHQAIRDLNRYVTPRLTIMDASLGMAEYHLGGPVCDPPLGKLVAGQDPLSVDRTGATLLGIDWSQVEYLRQDWPA